MLSALVPLHPDETILRTVRRHWFRVAVEAAGLGLVFLLTVLVVLAGEVFALTLPDTLVSRGVAGVLGVFVVATVGLFLWMKFFAVWSDHWLDVWIVTNRRIIDVEQKGFFIRQVSSFPLDRIQDVTYEVSGLIATWLNFGNVRIQTASISDDFIMRQVPHPNAVKDALMVALVQRNGGYKQKGPLVTEVPVGLASNSEQRTDATFLQ